MVLYKLQRNVGNRGTTRSTSCRKCRKPKGKAVYNLHTELLGLQSPTICREYVLCKVYKVHKLQRLSSLQFYPMSAFCRPPSSVSKPQAEGFSTKSSESGSLQFASCLQNWGGRASWYFIYNLQRFVEIRKSKTNLTSVYNSLQFCRSFSGRVCPASTPPQHPPTDRLQSRKLTFQTLTPPYQPR